MSCAHPLTILEWSQYLALRKRLGVDTRQTNTQPIGRLPDLVALESRRVLNLTDEEARKEYTKLHERVYRTSGDSQNVVHQNEELEDRKHELIASTPYGADFVHEGSSGGLGKSFIGRQKYPWDPTKHSHVAVPPLRTLFWEESALCVTAVLRMCWGLDIYGQQHLQQENPFIIVSNHDSHVDPLFLTSALPDHWRSRVLALAKENHSQTLFGQCLIRMCPSIIVRRDGSIADGISLTSAQKALESDRRPLIIFPSGTRSCNGDVGDFLPGAVLLGRATGCQIIPAHISGTFENYPKGGQLNLNPISSKRIVVAFGAPIRLEAGSGATLEDDLKNLKSAVLNLAGRTKRPPQHDHAYLSNGGLLDSGWTYRAEMLCELVKNECDIVEAVLRARLEDRKIVVRGAGYSTGGQTVCEHAIQLDFNAYTGVTSHCSSSHLNFDSPSISVRAGTTWRQLREVLKPTGYRVAIHQSYDVFTVGGSISVNAHGRSVHAQYSTVCDTVKSLRIVSAEGQIIVAHRLGPNQQLFRLACGGYGLLGVISEVELSLVPEKTTIVHPARVLSGQEFTTFLPLRMQELFSSEAANSADRLHNTAAVIFGRFSSAPGEIWQRVYWQEVVEGSAVEKSMLGRSVRRVMQSRPVRGVFLGIWNLIQFILPTFLSRILSSLSTASTPTFSVHTFRALLERIAMSAIVYAPEWVGHIAMHYGFIFECMLRSGTEGSTEEDERTLSESMLESWDSLRPFNWSRTGEWLRARGDQLRRLFSMQWWRRPFYQNFFFQNDNDESRIGDTSEMKQDYLDGSHDSFLRRGLLEILEVFVPLSRFGEFFLLARRLLEKKAKEFSAVTLLNTTVRVIPSNNTAFLNYSSKKELQVSMVITYRCDRSNFDEFNHFQSVVVSLTELVVKYQGSVYLPYRNCFSRDLFHACYPMWGEFCRLKRQYDPHELFDNSLWTSFKISADEESESRDKSTCDEAASCDTPSREKSSSQGSSDMHINEDVARVSDIYTVVNSKISLVKSKIRTEAHLQDIAFTEGLCMMERHSDELTAMIVRDLGYMPITSTFALESPHRVFFFWCTVVLMNWIFLLLGFGIGFLAQGIIFELASALLATICTVRYARIRSSFDEGNLTIQIGHRRKVCLRAHLPNTLTMNDCKSMHCFPPGFHLTLSDSARESCDSTLQTVTNFFQAKQFKCSPLHSELEKIGAVIAADHVVKALDGIPLRLRRVNLRARCHLRGEPIMLCIPGWGFNSDSLFPFIIDCLQKRPNQTIWLLDGRSSLWLSHKHQQHGWTIAQVATFECPSALHFIAANMNCQTEEIDVLAHCGGAIAALISMSMKLLPCKSLLCMNSGLVLQIPANRLLQQYRVPLWHVLNIFPANFVNSIMNTIFRRLNASVCGDLMCASTNGWLGGIGHELLWSHRNIHSKFHNMLLDIGHHGINASFLEESAMGQQQTAAGHLGRFTLSSSDVKLRDIVKGLMTLDENLNGVSLPQDLMKEGKFKRGIFDPLSALQSSSLKGQRAPIFFGVGDCNGLAGISPLHTSLSLQMVPRSSHPLDRAHIFPGYGHFDTVAGRTASEDVFPFLYNFMESVPNIVNDPRPALKPAPSPRITNSLLSSVAESHSTPRSQRKEKHGISATSLSQEGKPNSTQNCGNSTRLGTIPDSTEQLSIACTSPCSFIATAVAHASNSTSGSWISLDVTTFPPEWLADFPHEIERRKVEFRNEIERIAELLSHADIVMHMSPLASLGAVACTCHLSHSTENAASCSNSMKSMHAAHCDWCYYATDSEADGGMMRAPSHLQPAVQAALYEAYILIEAIILTRQRQLREQNARTLCGSLRQVILPTVAQAVCPSAGYLNASASPSVSSNSPSQSFTSRDACSWNGDGGGIAAAVAVEAFFAQNQNRLRDLGVSLRVIAFGEPMGPVSVSRPETFHLDLSIALKSENDSTPPTYLCDPLRRYQSLLALSNREERKQPQNRDDGYYSVTSILRDLMNSFTGVDKETIGLKTALQLEDIYWPVTALHDVIHVLKTVASSSTTLSSSSEFHTRELVIGGVLRAKDLLNSLNGLLSRNEITRDDTLLAAHPTFTIIETMDLDDFASAEKMLCRGAYTSGKIPSFEISSTWINLQSVSRILECIHHSIELS